MIMRRFAYERNLLLNACQMAYRYHCLPDAGIGDADLETTLWNVLTEVMGDPGFRAWLAGCRQERGDVV